MQTNSFAHSFSLPSLSLSLPTSLALSLSHWFSLLLPTTISCPSFLPPFFRPSRSAFFLCFRVCLTEIAHVMTVGSMLMGIFTCPRIVCVCVLVCMHASVYIGKYRSFGVAGQQRRPLQGNVMNFITRFHSRESL